MADQIDQPETPQPNEDAQAEERVRQMMEVERQTPVVEPPQTPKPEELDKPYAITEQPSSAPLVVDEPVAEQPVEEIMPPVAEAQPIESDSELAVDPDPETDHVVEDIVKSDSDVVLDSEDDAVQKAFIMKPSLWERFKNGLADWWGSPRKKWATLGVIIIIFVTVLAVPIARYTTLNLVGFRGYAKLTVLDATNDLPLKNAAITLGGQTGKTDVEGKIILQHVRLGKQALVVKKLAFAAYSQPVTVGLNGTTLGDVELKAVGTQFSFVLTDYTSGKPVAGAQVTSGDASALSDKNGKLILTVQPSSSPTLKVFVSGKGYRTDQLSIDTTLKTATPVQLVTTTKEIYVSKQSGKYDLYSVDVDGKNKAVLLAGTGLETQDMSLSVSPDNTVAGFVSTRDNQRDADGFLLSTLTIVNLQNGTTQTLDHAEHINLIGWSKGRLVYELVVAGASAANPSRERLFAYDTTLNKKTQLASANYFNGSAMIGDTIYYAVSGTDPTAIASFNKVNSDASNKQTIVKQEIYGIYRTAYNVLTLQTTTGWATYTVGDLALSPGSAPDSYTSRSYLDNAEGTDSLWVDTRDGKGVLIQHAIQTNQDATITTQSSLVSAVRWVDDQTVIYHVSSKQETADYVLSLVPGSQPKKIVDVTDVSATTQAN